MPAKRQLQIDKMSAETMSPHASGPILIRLYPSLDVVKPSWTANRASCISVPRDLLCLAESQNA